MSSYHLVPLLLLLGITSCSGAQAPIPITTTDRLEGQPPEPETEVPEPTPMSGPWQSPNLREHPLVGTIWSSATEERIDRSELFALATAAPFLLIGELHDNEDHHRLQAELIRIAGAGDTPLTVAFEMIDVEHESGLADLDLSTANPEDVAAAVAWSENWGHFDRYQSIVAAALESGVAIAAANIPRSRARALVRQGLSALEPDLAGRLRLDTPLPEPLHAALLQELRRAHCGHPMPQAMVEGMVFAQRARDAMMATRLIELAENGGERVILIAGNGHVRHDRGVPWELARRQVSTESILSIGLIEVREGLDTPSDYAEAYAAESMPFDITLFTPAANRGDPCAMFRRSEKAANDSSL